MSKGTASKTLDTIKWLVSLAIFTVAIVGNSYFVEVAFLYKVLGVVFLFIIGLIVLCLFFWGLEALLSYLTKLVLG